MVAHMTDDNTPKSVTSDTTSFGFKQVRAAERQALVNNVFARVADRYDLMNDLMSGGLHRLWKDDLIAWLAPPKDRPFRLIDVAGGTGDIARRFLNATGPQATAVICDISAEMIEAGRRRFEGTALAGRLSFVQGNAETLPFPDRSFDAYTIAFGIRNVTDRARALREAYRVLRPGGRFLCLEFSEVQAPILDDIYELYSFHVIPRLGEVVAGEREAYQYLVESIARFPDQDTFADEVRAAGFSRVQYRNLTGGIAAIHSGWRL
ncbi:demethylmenaquinone methyltransferase/2-methoxy-6-polyprenyl-1,4-benzoquinol methylase [Dichotomicrobium thermohalophilum]|uniref:Ubiquinone/menaquinone biosynthesis C-methyltransferase UbiE n=2 Tax=Dichotomicrobium thermohalophilum TaxID=933063 RepID=A0A397Q221_9HYPH|nr:demethylmenaquinone methyltransferase/2-methoxy-6-polyprenyl-1,4-benzoquinol methylase [Dichotomicrobium thermohalophilum]